MRVESETDGKMTKRMLYLMLKVWLIVIGIPSKNQDYDSSKSGFVGITEILPWRAD